MTAVDQQKVNPVKRQFEAEKGVVFVSKKQNTKAIRFLISLSLSKKSEVKVCAMGLVMERAIKILYGMQEKEQIVISKIETESEKLEKREDQERETYSNKLVITVKQGAQFKFQSRGE
jgi:DNA-binding protein